MQKLYHRKSINSPKLPCVVPHVVKLNLNRVENKALPITYYLSKPRTTNYPITIFIDGSTLKNNIRSIIKIYEYCSLELLKLGSSILAIEKYGITDLKILQKKFVNHYTRSQRLEDHKRVIEHIISSPPKGWNGRFIFLGASEGGIIATTLTEYYSSITIATINWCGACDLSWQEELWTFLIKNNEIPMLKDEYNALINYILRNPCTDKEFMGLTYKYHADAITYSIPDYQKINTPFLVVTGTQDSIIQSSDLFVQKARKAGVNISYMRIKDMDHYIIKRPDIIQRSFRWLAKYL